MDELIILRWENLNETNFSFDYVKSLLLDKYGINVVEENFKNFIQSLSKKYNNIDHQEILFELEDLAYKKISVFTIKEKDIEEFNDILRERFLKRNRLERIVGNKTLNEIDSQIYPCYLKFDQRYVTMKMACVKKFAIEEVDSDGATYSSSKKYFHCTKFVIDILHNLVFLFYNDIPNWDNEQKKGAALTEKKSTFYNLFEKGNQATLNRFVFTQYLNKYVKDYLDSVKNNGETLTNKIILIETCDPKKSKNKLKSSKIDGNHDKHRLDAIRYAIEKERNIVFQVECNINNIWLQFKHTGEIISSQTFFSKEVLKNVCIEIFPDYEISNFQEIYTEATS